MRSKNSMDQQSFLDRRRLPAARMCRAICFLSMQYGTSLHTRIYIRVHLYILETKVRRFKSPRAKNVGQTRELVLSALFASTFSVPRNTKFPTLLLLIAYVHTNQLLFFLQIVYSRSRSVLPLVIASIASEKRCKEEVVARHASSPV